MSTPVLKKRVAEYVKSEEGKISKMSLVILGSVLAGATLGLTISAKPSQASISHTNTISALSYNSGNGNAQAAHSHHGSHSSHGSHGSHSSHGSHGSHSSHGSHGSHSSHSSY